MLMQPVSTLTSISSISWTFFGKRVARARSFFTGGFLATTAVFRARPDLVRLTEKKNSVILLMLQVARDAVLSKWRSRELGRPRRAARSSKRFLGNDLTTVYPRSTRLPLPGSASATSASSPLAEDIVLSL